MERGDGGDRHLEGKMAYTKDFLLSFRHRKYKPPESVVRFNELYVYAPKPQVNRPRVDRQPRVSRSDFAQHFVSDSERQELKQKRKEEMEKLRVKSWSASAAQGSKPAPSPAKPAQAGTAVEAEAGNPTKQIEELLSAAQEQQDTFSGRKDGDVEPANRPGLRSLIPRRPRNAVESDDHRLEQRRKQLSYGYATKGYQNYLKLVPKDKRSKADPQTPNPLQKCSKRSWDGQLTLWRRRLHQYDPSGDAEAQPAPSSAEVEKAPAAASSSKASAHVSAQEREVLAQMRREAKQKGLLKKAAVVDTGVQCSDTSSLLSASAAPPLKPGHSETVDQSRGSSEG